MFPWFAGEVSTKPQLGLEAAGDAAQHFSEADAAAWKLGWAARGRYFEERLGRTLHPNFPDIDKIPNGIATSIKSIDLRAATYQDAGRLTSRLQKYVNDLSEFIGGSMGDNAINPSDITGRALSLAIPKGSMNAVQKEAIEAIRARARMKNYNPVQIIITEF